MLGDQRERPVVLVGIGLGVGDGRPHPHQQESAIGTDPGHVPGDSHPVIVGLEGVRQVHLDVVPGGGEAEGSGLLDREALRRDGEGPVRERNGVSPQHQRQAQQLAVRRNDLGRAAAVGGGHRPIAGQRRLDQPAAAGADAVGVQRRSDVDGVLRRSGGAAGPRGSDAF